MIMKVWIKLTKHFQGGSKFTYKLVEPNEIDTEEHQQEVMEEWGENSDGGHSYGYRVEMDTLEAGEYPPKEWLEKRIIQINEELTRLHGSILRKEELLETLQNLLK